MVQQKGVSKTNKYFTCVISHPQAMHVETLQRSMFPQVQLSHLLRLRYTQRQQLNDIPLHTFYQGTWNIIKYFESLLIFKLFPRTHFFLPSSFLRVVRIDGYISRHAIVYTRRCVLIQNGTITLSAHKFILHPIPSRP